MNAQASDQLRAEAEASGLLRVAREIHDRRREDMDAAVDVLAMAIDSATEAREAYSAAGETLLAASLLLARLRDASAGSEALRAVVAGWDGDL